ncbi:type II toxin-antitoxin system RelE/ParE family toxin [uncultured Parasutterella sp.]|uniref:type II toxin-antitoxin system RelE/ParE family toxin n=1 Tax=uncultured Parasutterella sp. TaxID=1263098 RepID=UPI00345153C8
MAIVPCSQRNETGSKATLQPIHAEKLKELHLAIRSTTTKPPCYRLHRLISYRQNPWSLLVHSDWCITFEFHGGDVHITNCEDYH